MEMESFMAFIPYLIHFLVLYVSLGFVYLVYWKSSDARLPRGSRGLPFIGETLPFLLASRAAVPEKFINDRMAKYSPDVFRTCLLGEEIAVFCGSSGNKFLFSGQNRYVTSWWPNSMKRTLMDPSSLNNSSREESNGLRNYLPAFLKPELLQQYIPIMDSMAKEQLEKEWFPYTQVKVFHLTKIYTFAVACRLFVGIEDQDHVAKFAQPFALATQGLISVPINLPGTAFSKAMKAGKLIREELVGIIRKRKLELLENKSSKFQDLLSTMLVDNMTEIEIGNKIIGLFIASHDTTSTAITFIISYLADYPDVYNKVLEEQMEILKLKSGGDQWLRWEDIQKMKYTWCVACEVMRLAPPAMGAFREAVTDFTYAGYKIPKGFKMFWSIHTTNKNPKYFKDPEKFDPSRFEGNGPAPFTFVPFGGGPRMCPGKEYARLEILIFIHNVVTKLRWKKVIPNEKISYVHSPIPRNGLPITLLPHPTLVL